MHTKTCSHCLGAGVITAMRYKTMKRETKTCEKCNGAKVINYKTDLELLERKRRERAARRKRSAIPVRWVPPEKELEEYEYEI